MALAYSAILKCRAISLVVITCRTTAETISSSRFLLNIIFCLLELNVKNRAFMYARAVQRRVMSGVGNGEVRCMC